MKNAFTMIELVFVIVVIGILAVVAVPKLAPLVDTAQLGKAKATLASVRSAISTERQKRILQGKFKPLTDLGDSTYAFNTFGDADGDTADEVLDYPVPNCASNSSSHCWKRITGTTYRYQFTSSSDAANFSLANNRLDCSDTDTAKCQMISR